MYSYNPYYEKYLVHYGVLGMKWGVRRFQNKDGTLTKAGIKKYKKKVNSKNTFTVSIARDDGYFPLISGGSLNSNNGDLTIKKGSILGRIANDETNDNKRKYLSVTSLDHDYYKKFKNYLPLDKTKPVKQYKYKAVKDIKIASPDKVINHILEKYESNSPVAKVINQLRSAGISMQVNDIKRREYQHDVNRLKDTSNNSVRFRDFNKRIKSDLNLIGAKTISKNENEIINYFVQQGYDGIADPIDSLVSGIDYPIILSTPVKFIKEESRESI